jgi:ribokinase
MSHHVFVLGSINVDLVVFTPRRPEMGETISGYSFMMAGGGKGANQAIAVSRSGGSVSFIGAVGDDSFGHDSLAKLSADSVNTHNVKLVKDVSTGVASITVVQGNNSIILAPGANLSLVPKDIETGMAEAKEGDYFLTEFENKMDDAIFGLRYARKKGMITFLNPSPMKRFSLSSLQYVDYLIVNEIETEGLCGFLPKSLDDAKTAFTILRKYGLKHLILTIGSGGSLYVDDKTALHISAFKIEPVDTTGAGDTYLGSFIARFSEGYGLEESLIYASKASSLACMKKGAQPSIPFSEEIIESLGKR